MFSVIFEVRPKSHQWDAYLGNARMLTGQIERMVNRQRILRNLKFAAIAYISDQDRPDTYAASPLSKANNQRLHGSRMPWNVGLDYYEMHNEIICRIPCGCLSGRNWPCGRYHGHIPYLVS